MAAVPATEPNAQVLIGADGRARLGDFDVSVDSPRSRGLSRSLFASPGTVLYGGLIKQLLVGITLFEVAQLQCIKGSSAAGATRTSKRHAQTKATKTSVGFTIATNLGCAYSER